MVCNYFNFIYPIPNVAGNLPKCLFTNCISFVNSWLTTLNPWGWKNMPFCCVTNSLPANLQNKEYILILLL